MDKIAQAHGIKKMTFVAASKDFFGLKMGQTGVQFMHEIKELSPEERTDIASGLALNGYEIISSQVAASPV